MLPNVMDVKFGKANTVERGLGRDDVNSLGKMVCDGEDRIVSLNNGESCNEVY